VAGRIFRPLACMLLIFRHGAGRLSAGGICRAVGHPGARVAAAYFAVYSRLRRHRGADIRRGRGVGIAGHRAVRRPSAGAQAGSENERGERAYDISSDYAPLLPKFFIYIVCRCSNIYVEKNLISDIIEP
jgi:hypothetical protein